MARGGFGWHRRPLPRVPVPCNTAAVSLEVPTPRPPRGPGTQTRLWGGRAPAGAAPRTHVRYHPTTPHPPLHLQNCYLTSSCRETEARPPAAPHSAPRGVAGGWRPLPHLSRRDGGAAAQLDDHLLAVVQRPAVAQLVQRAGGLGQHPHALARARQEAGREVAAGKQQRLGVFPWGGVAFRLANCRGQSQGQHRGRQWKSLNKSWRNRHRDGFFTHPGAGATTNGGAGSSSVPALGVLQVGRPTR